MKDSSSDRSEKIKEYVQRKFSILAGFFWANWVSSLGSMLLVVSTILILIFLAFHVYSATLNRPTNPYFDLVGFFVLPLFFLIGAALVIGGTFLRKWRRRRPATRPLVLTLSGEALRRRATIFGVISILGLSVLGVFSYEGYHYTDSAKFCMKVCHTVMQPEGVAYSRSPHANVSCVSCHIGPGASWFVRSKLSGVRQVFAVLGDTYDRPIPTPVHNLRPARETCEVCHWPEKFQGSRLIVHEKHAPDEQNTPYYNALVLKIGGYHPLGGAATGIHWHVDPNNQVRYRASDSKRQDIVEVVRLTPAGEVRYLREGADPDDTSGDWRVMDCIDCHNRPTHIFQVPESVVDDMLTSGRLSAQIPYLRREAVRVLREVQPDEHTADKIAAALTTAYQEDHPAALGSLRDSLAVYAGRLATALEGNVFPAMNVTWGTYTSNIGHFDAEGEMSETGCFRCHDEQHATTDGQTISQDCDLCHVLLAEQESDISSLPEIVRDFLPKP